METLEQSQQRFAGTEAGKMDAAATSSVELAGTPSPHPYPSAAPLITWTPATQELIEKHKKLRIYITAHEPTRNMVLAECDLSMVGALWLKQQVGDQAAIELLVAATAKLATDVREKEGRQG